jgi:hypothetical protein
MFVCIENNQVTSIINYQPNVPESIQVIEITDAEYQQIMEQTHYFDVSTISVKPVPQSQVDKKTAEKHNAEHRELLNSTDWKVLRHLRQKSLGIPTSLTEEEYINLETDRQNAANSIINP